MLAGVTEGDVAKLAMLSRSFGSGKHYSLYFKGFFKQAGNDRQPDRPGEASQVC